MSYDLSNDAEGSPTVLPGISALRLRRLIRYGVVSLGVLGLLLLFWWALIIYTNVLWFGHLGLTGVFTKIVLVKAGLFAGGALLSAVILAANFYIAHRIARGPSVLPIAADSLRLMYAMVGAGAVLTIFIASPIFGSAAAERWEPLLLLFHYVPFQVSDPAFGRDVSFYVVILPLLHLLQGWFMGVIITTLIASLVLYLAILSLRGVNLLLRPREMRGNGAPLGYRILRHLAWLGVALMLTLALMHVLNIYELVLSAGGAVYGATYTDVKARIPVLWFLTAIALLSAVGLAISPFYRGLRLIAGSFSLWVVMVLLAGLAFPALFQRFQVSPNEFAREEPYIRYNIQATRAAYQLDHIDERPYAADARLDQAALADNRNTVENIRLWEPAPLKDAYNQLQFMTRYYNFLNMDSDRYQVDGRLRQVLVGARELVDLDSENLPGARKWVNQRLQYTHGYGVAMSPATDFTPGEGRPEFFIRDIPIQSKLPLARPEIYYGESPEKFAIVNTSLSEVDPDPDYQGYAAHCDPDANPPTPGVPQAKPVLSGAVETLRWPLPVETSSLAGKGDAIKCGGIPLSSSLRRLAFAVQLTDVNVLISDRVGPESRVQYRRQIRERVRTLAPFLKLDRDPYPVLDRRGKLWWILDTYTTTNRYPYSTPAEPLAGDPSGERKFNYIRNSVKVAIDAYNGSVNFYLIDPEDPLARMYQRAFPRLFQDISAMPADLREHLRYPVGLFSTQAQQYLRYHVTNPQVLFNQAEQWALPLETRIAKTGVEVVPSYLVMQLPGEDREEFVLLLPLTPAGEKKNLVAWLAARNDWPNYGQVLSFQLPDHRQIDGPSQVEARIENDQSVSQQFTLWDGSGSDIIRGQLLVIPIADTIIYVEPLYLQSEALPFPELKKVILADDSNLVMADTIDEGIARLLESIAANPGTGESADGPLPQLQTLEQQIGEIKESLNQLEKGLSQLKEALRKDTADTPEP